MTQTSTRGARTLGYQPGLDGLRAAAVLAVVAGHSIGPLDAFGPVGVSVFFTLSGFLITSLLLEEEERAGRISLGAFYLRRALRLLPALAAMLVLVGVLVAVTGTNVAGRPLTVLVPAVAFYYVNWVSIAGWRLGYLTHTWSLAVEEQFYLVWPPLLAYFGAKLFRRVIPAVIVTVVIARASAAFRWDAGSLNADTFLVLDLLMIGAMLAWHVRTRPSFGERINGLAFAGAAAVVIGLAAGTSATYPNIDLLLQGGYTVIALAVSVMILHLLHRPTSLWARVMSSRPLVQIGKVSYGIYLFHYPIFQYVSQKDLPGPNVAYSYTATAVTVLASWWLIERPALRLKSRIGRATGTVGE